jgi:hypothetical protein
MSLTNELTIYKSKHKIYFAIQQIKKGSKTYEVKYLFVKKECHKDNKTQIMCSNIFF